MTRVMNRQIPTNLITGFLGTGKTTAILYLLSQKPEHETWAVLVNEFGEVGIDGAIMKGKGAVVREVPGGCMCCVAGLPMQIGLNMLIARSKPDRILIEPTGLGHPEQILQTLKGEFYDDVLDLQASICLVDPRHLAESRYLENDNFRDQILVSDVLVANKTDLCTKEDRTAFENYAQSLPGKSRTTGWVAQGELNVDWLNLPGTPRNTSHPDAHAHAHDKKPAEAPLTTLPEGKSWIRKENKGQGHRSYGWLFSSTYCFDYQQITSLFHSLDVDRLKAVIITERGIKGFNMEGGVLTEVELDESDDSRVEVIHYTSMDWSALEISLLKSCY